MKVLKKIIKVVLILILILVLGFAGIIVCAVISDYKPGEMTSIELNDKPAVIADSATLTFLTWNIGYCGLDKDMDFFYDGGTKVFTSEEKCLENLSSITRFLKENDTIDFMNLQEVDRRSKRSYNFDEYDSISTHLNYA
jgi:hypothetical protein